MRIVTGLGCAPVQIGISDWRLLRICRILAWSTKHGQTHGVINMSILQYNTAATIAPLLPHFSYSHVYNHSSPRLTWRHRAGGSVRDFPQSLHVRTCSQSGAPVMLMPLNCLRSLHQCRLTSCRYRASAAPLISTCSHN